MKQKINSLILEEFFSLYLGYIIYSSIYIIYFTVYRLKKHRKNKYPTDIIAKDRARRRTIISYNIHYIIYILTMLSDVCALVLSLHVLVCGFRVTLLPQQNKQITVTYTKIIHLFKQLYINSPILTKIKYKNSKLIWLHYWYY